MSINNVNLSNIDFSKSNVIFVDGLTLEMVKVKYNWLFNAKIKDAVIGENQNGLVWYFGDWLCGEWVNGTWYSGTFHDGHWLNGQWYSYNLNKFDVLSQNFNILEIDNTKSKFLNGVWENGSFNSGTFGENKNEDWLNFEQYDEREPYRNSVIINFRKDNGNEQYENKKVSTWVDGIFNDGLIYDSIWTNGIFYNGYITNTQWVYGKFFNGVFDGHTWFNGNFYNGQFIKGRWLNGVFTKFNQNLVSRFGNTILSGSTICEWFNGEWVNGEFFSGYITDSKGVVLPSINNNISIWYDGHWKNGHWWGGHFKSGVWDNGLWYNGIFGDIYSSEWLTPNKTHQISDGDSVWMGDMTTPETHTMNSTITGGTYFDSKETVFTTLEYDTNLTGGTNNSENTYYEITGSNVFINISWSFNNIQNGYLVNLTNSCPLQIGSLIYIIHQNYEGYGIIESFSPEYGNKWVKLENNILNETFNSVGGSVYDKSTSQYIYDEKTSNTLCFKGFENTILNNELLGYQVKMKKEIYNVSSPNNGNYYDDYISLSVNGIKNYNPNFFQDFGDTQHKDFNIKKIKSTLRSVSGTTISELAYSNNNTFEEQLYLESNKNYESSKELYDNNITDSIKKDVLQGLRKKDKINQNTIQNYYYGSFYKFWYLDSLNQYISEDKILQNYPNPDDTYKPFINKINYGGDSQIKKSIENILSADTMNTNIINNLEIHMNFNYSEIFSKRLRISDVGFRFFYKPMKSAIWNNGVWNRGTFINGVFNNGIYSSGLWLNGEFNSGIIGGER